MALSNDLVSQFAKITKDNEKTSNESTVYGTVVEYNNSKYVKLDGSELLTPVSATANGKDGDRVTVMIKNHTATITGNTSSPSATTSEVTEIGTQISEFEVIIADKVDTTELNAANARIDELQADNVTIKETLTANVADITALEADNATIKDTLTANQADITSLKTENATITGRLDAADADIDSLQADNVLIRESLTANEASIGELEAKNVTINGLLEANQADIDDLYATKLSTTDAAITYATIDFSNIGKAAIENFYATSGVIQDITVGDGTVTGKLVGVTISGDLIEGNTIVAEKLVIKGEDGLYYALNTNGETVEASQTDYNSLDGSHIKAKSITATKISVSDLVAFDATIGGFNITDNSIYSGVKESVDNTTRGIYLDNDGQVAFGDSNNFLKFFKDIDETYKLVISAQSILLGTSGRNVETSIDEVQTNIDELEIGGRNLLQGTRYMSDYYVDDADTISISIDSESFGTASVNTIESLTLRSVQSRPSILFSSIRGKEVTFSFEVRSDDYSNINAESTQGIQVCFCLCSSESDDRTLYREYAMYDVLLSDTWQQVTITETLSDSFFTSGEGTIDSNTRFYISLYPYTTYTMEVRKFKLELGNKATDWSPAPEDVDEEIDELQAATEANTTRLNDAQLEIDSINASISSLVTGQNGESLMTQTENGWTFNMSQVQNTLDTAVNDIDDLNNNLNNANTQINTLNQSVSDLGVYTEYITVGVEDSQPCITLGETDSEFKVKITNTAINFMEGSSVPASISNKALNIGTAVIKNELQQGNFSWVIRNNGNLGLVWKGA